MRLHEVHVPSLPIGRFAQLLDPDDWARFQAGIALAHELLADRELWNVNSTAAGGGVAEMLRSFVSYARGAGIDMRWVVISGGPDFFRVTKRLHNFLHGSAADGGTLGKAERHSYESTLADNANELLAMMRTGDIVFLHDPQPAGIAPRLKEAGAIVVWRCHIGTERANRYVRQAWEFLRPYLESVVDAYVFSRQAYVPDWAANGPAIAVVPPSIDVFAPKNQEMNRTQVQSILAHVGLVGDGVARGTQPTFEHHDGSPGRVDHFCEMLSTGPAPHFDEPLVVQVSRWDRLKDPIGVMRGFADYAIDGTQAHLIIAGPNVRAVADDPEGARVLDETEAAWRELPHSQRSRVHLACLPMIDVEENAAIVNALQRQASIVVQKSIQEGFGLTVTEAMWKARPVVASAVGGIRDQITDGVDGFLLQDPTDLEGFGSKVLNLLLNPDRAHEIGSQAREHVRRNYLENRHSLQYVELLKELLGPRSGI
jgi:trehalose synthase